jgi:Tfp pilus assembly protein PilE
MGQQQLLLVILVTIIVGIATVVAINTFGAAADSANVDAVRQDLASIAAAAQGYYMKPEMLGGGGRTFEGITFNDIAFGARL